MQAHVLIGRACVNDCVFCAVADKRRRRSFPERAAVVRFIEEAARWARALAFSGLGEPTLDPHFEEYLALAGRLGFERVVLFTNGHRAADEKARRWKELGLSSVLLSMHGLEGGHDASVASAGSFRAARAALEIYLRQGFTVTVNSCITRANLGELAGLRELLEPLPITLHTLTFPEWSGNALRFADRLAGYGEVAAAAPELIPAGDTRTYFANIPYCIVRRKTLEGRGPDDVRLLDGSGEKDPREGVRTVLPPACTERSCPLALLCSGFERRYVERRGWEDLPQHAERFLDALEDPAAPALPAWSPPRRAPQRATTELRRAAGRSAARSRERGLTVVIKPTSRCNAGCRYCCAHKIRHDPVMTLDTVRRAYQELAAHARRSGRRRVHLLWHGGEPMLMGKAFYEEAWRAAQDYREPSFTHQMQSNLLLFDREWGELLRRHGVGVGTSVDPIGPDRILHDGSPQYPLWLEKFLLAAELKIDLGIVFTLTAGHLGRGREVYGFFKNLQSLVPRPVGVRLNPMYPAGAAARLGAGERLRPEQYGAFLLRVGRLWEQDGMPFRLSPLVEWRAGAVGSCDYSASCHEHFLGLDAAARVYNCGRFMDGGVSWGNLREQRLDEILEHPDRRRLAARAAALRAGPCRECLYWDRCHGGCPYQAQLVAGDVHRASPFCAAYRLCFARSDDAAGRFGEERAVG